jgi:hypothetical protein
MFFGNDGIAGECNCSIYVRLVEILNNGEHNPSAGERFRGMKKREVTANAVTSPDSGSDVSG